MPILGTIPVLVVKNQIISRWIALGFTLATFVVSLSLPIFFDWHKGSAYAYSSSGGTMQMVADAPWIPAFKVHYKVGIDGLSLPLILLTTFIMSVACVASWGIDKMRREYFALLLFLETALLGVFLSLDLLQFYVFLEVSLLPVYLLIGIWGGPRREYAAIKFFLYTLAGSVCLLIAVIGIYLYGHSFDLVELASPASQAKLALAMGGLGGSVARTLFVLLMMGFLVKLPVVPFHTWLPDAHVEAPTPVSMILAGLVLNLGGYGVLRVAYPLFPQAAKSLWLLFAAIGVISMVYGGFCALAQTDFKRLIAYSSMSQLGLLTLGAAMMTPAATNGALFMMLAHGITSATLFFIAGVIHQRAGHCDINRLGGLTTSMPIFTGFSIPAFFANLGLPGLCGFVGEVLVLLGTFQAARPDGVLYQHAAILGHLPGFLLAVRILAVVACCNIVITAGYMLWTLQRVYFGPPRPDQTSLSDLTANEITVLTPLAAMTILLGLFPMVFVFALSNTTLAAMFKLY